MMLPPRRKGAEMMIPQNRKGAKVNYITHFYFDRRLDER